MAKAVSREMMRRAVLVLLAMATALVMGSGAAMAVGPAKDGTTQDNATKESTSQSAPNSGKAASAAGSKISKVFGNATPIQIPASGSASPYASEIEVSGFPEGSKITDVNLALLNFSHGFPLDVDVLLVGPTGKNAIVMSDVGGQGQVSNVSFVIDDEASNHIPSDKLFSGRFKPTNKLGGDTFPAPASEPSGKTKLSVFDGTNPNGTWKLFVFDDSTSDSGVIQGGWDLDITAK